MASSSRAAAEDKNEPAWPLAIPYPSVHPAASDVDEAAQTATGWRSVQYLRKRRCLLCCCGCCVLAVVIVGLVVLVLALTVLKVKDPRLTMNGVSLTALSTGEGSGSGSGLAVNATVIADVSVKNPNVASFRFSQSATEVYYRGQTVSVAYVPAGRVGARRTVRMNMTVDVLGDRFARVLNGTGGLVLGQEYDLTTYTEMNGTVRVLGVYERELQIRMNCSIIMEVGGAAGDMMGSGTPAGVQSKGASCVARVS
uniref:Uncharacterized protein n=1 Tax=Avena sativa TaxID=4498 RepID=A0ACD5U175_AVESA